MKRSTLRVASLLALLLCSPLALGCAFGELRWNDPLEHEYSLEQMQKRYTDLVRFGNFTAASRYVAREDRKSYLASLPDPDAVRFLDYETEPLELNPELTYALVEVTYVAYSPWSLVQFRVSERQEWTRSDNYGNDWKVKSDFRGLEPYVASSGGSAGSR